MGYESRLIVVQEFANASPSWLDENGDGKCHCEEIATFNLCCMGGDFYNKIRKWNDSKFYIWEDHEETDTDKYGDIIKQGTLDEAIDALKNCLKRSEGTGEPPYRRIAPVLAMLEQFKADTDKWGNLYVLHYGY